MVSFPYSIALFDHRWRFAIHCFPSERIRHSVNFGHNEESGPAFADPLQTSLFSAKPYQASTLSGAGSDSRMFSGGGATNL
jgi:hypothetical protein